jgi:hypothetical protein
MRGWARRSDVPPAIGRPHSSRPSTPRGTRSPTGPDDIRTLAQVNAELRTAGLANQVTGWAPGGVARGGPAPVRQARLAVRRPEKQARPARVRAAPASHGTRPRPLRTARRRPGPPGTAEPEGRRVHGPVPLRVRQPVSRQPRGVGARFRRGGGSGSPRPRAVRRGPRRRKLSGRQGHRPSPWRQPCGRPAPGWRGTGQSFAFALAEATGNDAYELECRLGHQSQRYIHRYTNPPEDIAAGYVEQM